jgi:hypothetical protein
MNKVFVLHKQISLQDLPPVPDGFSGFLRALGQVAHETEISTLDLSAEIRGLRRNQEVAQKLGWRSAERPEILEFLRGFYAESQRCAQKGRYCVTVPHVSLAQTAQITWLVHL